MADQVAAKGLYPCASAVSLTRLPDARIGRKVQPVPVDLSTIEGFGFDTRMKMGVGGFLTTDVFPVVLFRNGDLLRDVTGL